MSRKPFAVFDIDGTLIRWQLYHATADALVRLGYFDSQVFDEVKAARMLWKKRAAKESFANYEEKLVGTYANLLKQLSTQQFKEAVNAVFDEYKDQVYRYTRGLIQELQARGYLLFAISGSQIEIVAKIADYYGFDDCVGSVFESEAGKFTGKVTSRRQGKHLILEELVKRHNATYADSYGVGDSEGDITMLEAVNNPIAFNPTEKLFHAARRHGWKVVVERKNLIYELIPENNRYFLSD